MELKQELQPGTTLQNGEYTIEKKLGQGGFGITYLAFSKGLQCKLAIKEFFLSSNCMRQTGDVSVHIHSLSLDDFAGFKNRFLSEAQTLAQFDRIPNIVHVKSVFEENNTAYYVMDYLQGETLAQLVKRKGKLSYEEAMNFMGQLCDATEAIHLKGIIHRDINPSNIIITPDNKAVLIDFGTAKEYIQGNTRSTQAIITPGYAPEEQYSTKREKGKYTDIYAIGATMYYCLTGEIPIESIDRRSSILKEPKTLNTAIPNNVNMAILKAMSIEADDRYQTVQKLAKDFLMQSNIKTENSSFVNNKNTVINNKEELPKKAIRKYKIIYSVLIVLIILIIGVFIKVSSNNTEKYVINYSKAKKYLEIGRYDSTEIYFKKALEYKKTDSLLNQIKILSFLIPGLKNYYDAKYFDAVEKFKDAALLGSGDAYYYLGELAYNGVGTKRDYKEGFKYTNEAIKMGFKMALWRLGVVYGRGLGVKKNKNLSDKYYLECFDVVKRMAEAGDPEALGNLGSMYRDGEGVNENKQLGLEYYKKSFQNGGVWYSETLAFCYLFGEETEKNIDEGIRLFRIAAEKEDPNAQCILGKLYIDGEYLQKDVSLGLDWIQKAADQNYVIAWYYLGMYYLNEKQDEEKAFQYFKKTFDCSMDYLNGVDNLAYCYATGLGTEKSYYKAMMIYKQKIEQDTSVASNYNYKISILYHDGGPGLPKDINKFKEYCQMASDEGNEQASNSLGVYFYDDEKNKEEAIKFFKLAINQGSSKAQENLDYINKKE